MQSNGHNVDEATSLHERAVVIDGEGVCVLLPTVYIPPPEIEGRSFLDRARSSGLTAMNTSLGTGGIATGRDDLRALLHSIYGHLVYFELHPNRLVHVLVADDVLRAKREGKLGIVFGAQGLATKIEGDLTLVRILHRLGLRIAQFTHHERNALGCGCAEKEDTGLTQLGRACVAEMNRVGMLVDLAHAGQRTAQEAFDHSALPCIVSHANARALNAHPRNLTDETLRALAARGGVIGITAYSAFCETEPRRRPTIDDVVSHIAYVVDLVGVEHVGIGSDFFETESEVRYADFGSRYRSMGRRYPLAEAYAEGLERVDHLPRLTAALLRRGFDKEDILKVLGGNFLRVFREVWKP